MPIEYQRDDVKRRVVITFQGEFQADDVFAVIARYHTEDTWSYGLIWDTRRLTGTPTLADLRQFMRQDAQERPGVGRRGPVAILATNSFVYMLACSYAALGQSKMTIRVFRDFDEADTWLTAETIGTD